MLDTNNDGNAPNSSGKQMIWLKRIGVVGFLFFLLKGLFWIAVFYGLFKNINR